MKRTISLTQKKQEVVKVFSITRVSSTEQGCLVKLSEYRKTISNGAGHKELSTVLGLNSLRPPRGLLLAAI